MIVSFFWKLLQVTQHGHESHAGDNLRFLLQLERGGHLQEQPKDITLGYHELQNYHAAWENDPVDMTGSFKDLLCPYFSAPWTNSILNRIDPRVLRI